MNLSTTRETHKYNSTSGLVKSISRGRRWYIGESMEYVLQISMDYDCIPFTQLIIHDDDYFGFDKFVIANNLYIVNMEVI